MRARFRQRQVPQGSPRVSGLAGTEAIHVALQSGQSLSGAQGDAFRRLSAGSVHCGVRVVCVHQAGKHKPMEQRG